MKKHLIYFCLIFSLIIMACESKKQAQKFKILSPNAGAAVSKGQSVLIKFSVPSEFTPMDSLELSIDGKTIITKKDHIDSILIDTQDLDFGSKTIGAKIFLNGKSETTFSNIVIVPPAPKKYSFKVINEYPHDPDAFTQGLEVHKGVLYESTGQYDGKSSLRKVEISSGKILKKINLANEFFGEGLTIIGNSIIQLTWLENKGFVYDLHTFAKQKEFSYDSKIKEGWGICYSGNDLIMSDGTEFLHFLDPKSFKIKHSLKVLNHNGPVQQLNELEYIDGFVYANIYQTDLIAIIDPLTGAMVGEINLVGINPERKNTNYNYELNGIAFDPEGKRILVTGKNWAKLFHIELVEL